MQAGDVVVFVMPDYTQRPVRAAVTAVHEDGSLALVYPHPDTGETVRVEEAHKSDRPWPGYWQPVIAAEILPAAPATAVIPPLAAAPVIPAAEIPALPAPAEEQ